MKKIKRFLALFLVLCMMLSVVPFSAFAAEGSDETSEGESEIIVVDDSDEEELVEEELVEEEPVVGEPDGDESGEEDSTTEATSETVEASAEFYADVVETSLTMGTKPENGTTTDNPFTQGTGGSNSFRIPAMVTLSDGTIVAAADARWNTTYDGGGLDTIVSYSTDNGANWNYTFANYLGDNGNEYNGSGSTAFIDPALATDGSTVYMLCDLYPYGVALNGSGNTAPSTAVGFNDDGTLKLAANGSSAYDFYLKDGQIYDSGNNVVSGYTVDAYFNIKNTDETISTNLFFSDSPYQVVRTGYLYLTSSSDGGKTWSAPTLIPNVKTSSEQVCLVGPGRGLVTGGKIIFPVYSYNSGNQQMGFIYSTDGGASWTRVASFTGDSWSSESAVVALNESTLRFFYRNGNSQLRYADYTWGTGWGSAVSTGIATNSNTQISAISYSKTVDGKQVILVSCPTGPNEVGSSNSSATNRLNGKIFVGLVNTDGTMSWQDNAKISVPSVNSSNQFMYSCLTELNDGKVAILYEDYESAWGNGYYTMSFKTYDLNLTTDGGEESNDPVTKTDEESGISATAAGLTSVSATEVASSTPYTGYTASVTYSITLNGGIYTDSAEIKIPYDSTFDGCTDFIGSVTDSEGKVDTFSVELTDGYFVGIVPHFSDVTISGRTLAVTTIELKVGEIKTETDRTGNYESSYTGEGLNESIATVTVKGATTEGTPAVKESVTKVTTLSAGTYIIGNGTQWLTLNDSSLGSTTDASQATQWTITASGSSWTIKSGDYYLYHDTNSASLSASTTSSTWSYSSNTGFYYTYYWGIQTAYLRWSGSGWQASKTNSNNGAAYTYTPGQDAVEGADYTTITFTGVSAGPTSVVVGTTQYNITVSKKTETVNLTVGGSVPYDDASTGTPVVRDSTVASATLSGGKLTITGLKDGTTTVTTDTTVYTVTVSDGTPISIKKNETTTISVDLADGQYVKWSSTDSNYVGVAGKYDTSAGAYTNEAILAGQKITESPVTVTGTVYNADGTVAGTYKWLVTVTEGNADTNASSKGIYFNIATIEHCTVYYSINGGELIPVNGTGVTTGNWTGNGTYKGHFNIMFFAAPDEGYALTYMSISGSADQYYTLANGNPDGTGSDAWPFNDPAASTIPSSSSDSAWKTVNGSMHGFRWSLLEGNMTIDQMKVLFSNAIALGCDGATTITKNGTEGMGSASSPTVCKFVAQKLPTVKKSITSITRGTETITDLNGFKVKIGDTINYSVVVTRYATNATYGTITYDNEILTDELTNNNGISNPDMGTSTTRDQTYTYNTSITLTKENFGTVVTGGTITNEAEFKYTYKSQYSTGSIDAKSSAVVEVTVEIPSYVVDFGLPVEINLTGSTSGAGSIVSCKSGQYGTATLNSGGTGFTYTPTGILQGVDYVEFTYRLNDDTTDYTYRVAIYPATTVYYEEGFAEYSNGWENTGSKGTGTQATQATNDNRINVYGYDAVYDGKFGSSNGTQATSSNAGNTCDFTFTGTGFEVYANCTPTSGFISSVVIRNEGGAAVKAYMVNTVAMDGTTDATTGQATNLYSLPIISEQNLAHGTYKVTITHIKTDSPIYIDGFRIYGTMETEPDFYTTHLEDKPVFIELRDRVLASLNATAENSNKYANQIAKNLYSQVYATADGKTNGAIVTSANVNYTDSDLTDLLDNGPKNEIFLRNGQALTFKIETSRVVQIGLKSPNGGTTYTVNNGDQKTISTSTDMFYTVLNKGSSGAQTITITNTGTGILSVTKLKVCDDPNVTLGALTEEDLIPAMLSLGYELDHNGSGSTESGEGSGEGTGENGGETGEGENSGSETPEVTYADASLTVALVDYKGKQVASAELTANGVEGETSTFTAEEVLAAAKAQMPKGYELADASKVTGAEVVYGQSGAVSVRIGKVATLKVTYVNLFGKKVGTATITKVQTSNGNCQISASEIRENAPAGRRTVWLSNVKIPYGSERSIVVPVL